MKKKRIAAALLLIFVVALAGCGNQQVFDTTYYYDQAMVAFPDGTSQTLKIKSWKDYSDGDQIQILTEDGISYLFHSSNIVLVDTSQNK